MSVKIHHGPPGSYKTSGAVMDDFIAAVFAGRVIVTNVRGLNDKQNVVDVLSKVRQFPRFWNYCTVPETFDIIWIDTETLDGRQRLASFHHWVPHGAFLLIDEAQTVWPLAWKDTDLKRLDYPGGYDAAVKANRPQNFLIAFEKHRHYGWDLVLTTPNIDKIRKDIRGCSEGAYKHKNQALIGFKGAYLEAFHLAEDSGKSASDFLSVRNRKIKKYVWRLYASTATGTHSDTIAGSPLWKNPKVLLLVVFLSGLVTFLLSRPAPAIIAGKDTASGVVVDSKKPASSSTVSSSGGVAIVQAVQPVTLGPFNGYRWRLAGTITSSSPEKFVNAGTLSQFFYIKNDTEEVLLSSKELRGYGYSIKVIDRCHVDIIYRNAEPFSVFCKKDIENKTLLATN